MMNIYSFAFCLGRKKEVHNNYYFGDDWNVFKNNG